MSGGTKGLWTLFIRKGKVFVPTTAKTEAGYYLGIEPVAVVDASDRAAVKAAFLDSVNRGNPIVPTPSRANFPPDPLLKYAKVKSVSEFAKSVQGWQLTKYATEYVAAPDRPGKYGGSEQDDSKKQVFLADEPIDSIVSQLVDQALGAFGTG
jgi:hypothetical protein